MSKPPAFQFYASDFLAGTCDMSAEEVGAYIRLLCYQWDRGFIPNDAERCERIAGCSSKALANVWQKFSIILAEDVRRNERPEQTRAEQVRYPEAKATAGAQGGRKKAELWQTSSKPLAEGVAEWVAKPSSPTPTPILRDIYNADASEEPGKHVHPNESAVVAHAKAFIPPIPETFALAWFAEMEGAGWIDRQHRPIHPSRWKRSLEGAWRNSKHVSQEITARAKNAIPTASQAPKNPLQGYKVVAP